MTTEGLFHQLLRLDRQWRVTRSVFSGAEMHLWIEETGELWTLESTQQGQPVSGYDHVEEMTWRHLNVFEFPCLIHCRLPRGRRSGDGKVYRVTPPWEGLCKHFTQAFEAMVLLLMRSMAVAQVAELVGEHDTRLWRILKAHVAKTYPQVDFSGVRVVACDEVSVRRGHRYITVFCDLIERHVLFACEGKDSSTWKRFVEELQRHGGKVELIEEASMDMSPAYIKGAADNCPQAVVVFDKFHVIAKVCEGQEQVRRHAQRQLPPGERDGLKNSRFIWLMNQERLSQAQRESLKGLFKLYELPAKAYQLRLALQTIYELADAESARHALSAWCDGVHRIAAKQAKGAFAGMQSCAKMILRHMDGILAHWKHRTTNAYMEGLNSVFSAVKRRARGYRTVSNQIAMLYFLGANLGLPRGKLTH